MEYLLKLKERRRTCLRGAEVSNVPHITSLPSNGNDDEDDDEDDGSGDYSKPTVRTQTPAFVANLRKIKENTPSAVDDSLQPISRGRGMPTAGSSIRPPSTLGRGRRNMESIEATTLKTCSVGSTGNPRERLVGLGRGYRVGSSSTIRSIPEKNLYSNFVFDRRSVDVEHLPITKHRESIINTINSNAVTIIQGSTGCGKSTQVPQFILDDSVKKNIPCNIVVTQPRRIAATTLAERVSKEREWDVGDLVGYQIGLNRKMNENTRILFVTVGVLLEKLIHASDLDEWTHVILDEVHERSQDMDLCLLIVKQLFLEKRPSTRIILMSASAQTDRLSQYFSTFEHPSTDDDLWSDHNTGNTDLQRKHEPPILTVDGRMYHVDVFYMDDIENIFQKESIKMEIHKDEELEDDTMFEERREVLKKLLLYFDVLDQNAADKKGHDKVDRGSVLVFLPGISQITDVRDHLVGYRTEDTIMEGFEHRQHHWHIVPLHSSIPQSEQRQVFKPASSGNRKIILSTNIAESSITVPDIRYVVDFCMTKRLRRSLANSNFSTLRLESTSKSSCEQRKGRAGRLEDGRCYRLIWKDTYHALSDFCPAEMQIAPLEHVILRVKLFNRDPVSLLTDALDKPDLEDIGQAILTLKEIGALSVMRKLRSAPNEDEDVAAEFDHRRETHGGCMVENLDHMDGDLTFVGRLISRLPVDVHVGKLIALGYVFGNLKDAIIIAAGISGSKNIFKQPFQGEKPENVLEAYHQRLIFSQVSYSDCFAIRNAYHRYELFMTTEYRGRREDLEAFCNLYYFDKRALNEMTDLIMEIKSRLSDVAIQSPPDKLPNMGERPDESNKLKDFLLQLAIAGAFYPNYFIRKHNSMVEGTAQRMFGDRDPKYCVGLGQFPMNKGLLYCDQLKRYFKRLCLKKYPDCNARIDSHDTKTIVDFSEIKRCDAAIRRDQITRAAALPVYLALKAKQIPRLRPYLIEVAEDEAVQNALEAIQKQSLLKYQTTNASFDNARLLYENHIGYPGLNVKHIKVKVTHVKQCCHFFGIYRENENDLRCIEDAIHQYLSTNPPRMSVSSILSNSICLAPRPVPRDVQNIRQNSYNPPSFARVSLVNRSSNKTENTWRVKYLDYGGMRTVHVHDLFELPDELRSVQHLGLEFQVAEVQPHSIFRPSGEYSEEDSNSFKNKLFRMKYLDLTIYSLVGSCLRVRLEHSLEFLGPHAIEHKEEDLPSQSDHLERLKARRLSRAPHALSECSEKGHEEKEIIKRCHQRKHLEEEERLLKKLSECVMKSGSTFHRKKINVTGPEHPYELRFYGMTSYTSGSKISIAQDSVNSVAIDDQPQCHLDRLLVAGLVHSSPRDDGQLTLRHTTLLPNLPGLPSLVTMIFAPVAELRVNSGRTRYTGAVCGLGYDENGHPIHPQNDLEVVFDTHFDSKTLINVNEIRLALNMLLSDTKWKDEQMGHYHAKVVSDLQGRIENAVENLFLSGKPVHLVNRMENTRPFLWKLLPSTAFIDNSKEISKELTSLTNNLYQCHFSVNGVDYLGMNDYLRSLCVGTLLNEKRIVDRVSLREFQPRWKQEMTLMLNEIYKELTRLYMNGRGTISGELEKPFICEICPSRPDTSSFGYICPTAMSAVTHLFSESHKRSEESIRYQRSPMTSQLNSLISD